MSVGLAVLLGCCCTPYEETGCVGLGLHIGKSELGVLETGDGASELNALINVLYSLVDSALSDTDSLCRNTDTAAVEGCHGDLEALAFLTEEVFLGNLDVVENELAGSGCAKTHLILRLRDGEALQTSLEDEGADASGALLLVGHGENDENVGCAGIGDEDLAAV